jgi:hypothetical protein
MLEGVPVTLRTALQIAAVHPAPAVRHRCVLAWLVVRQCAPHGYRSARTKRTQWGILRGAGIKQIDGLKIRVEEAMAAGKAALAQADAALERAEAGDRSALEEAAQHTHTHTPIGAVRAGKVLGAQTAHSALVQFVQDVRGFLPSSAGSNSKELGVHAEPVHDEQDLERTSWSPVQAPTSAAYKSLTVRIPRRCKSAPADASAR